MLMVGFFPLDLDQNLLSFSSDVLQFCPVNSIFLLVGYFFLQLAAISGAAPSSSNLAVALK